MHTTARLFSIFVLVLPACNNGGDGTTDGGASSSGSTGSTGASGTSGTGSEASVAETSSTVSPTSDAETSSTASTGSTSLVTSTSSGSEGTSSTSEGDTSTSTDGTGTTGEPVLACEADGGICMGAGTCVVGDGTIAPSSPGGCQFDDGEAECCLPPPAMPDPTTCTEAGGLCAPIAGCLQAGGHFTTNDEGCEFMGNFACCVPHDACGDPTIECCDGQAVFRPACDEGMFVCAVGEPVPIDTCL